MAVMLLALGWRTLKPYLAHVAPNLLDLRPLVRMVKLGLPIGAQMMLEGGAFNIMALLMGWLGVVQVAAHQIALNLASLTFMVPLGVSSAAAVIVGHAVGRGDPAGVRRSTVASLVVGAGFMLCTGVLFVAAPEPLAGPLHARRHGAHARRVAAADRRRVSGVRRPAGRRDRPAARARRHAHADDRQHRRLLVHRHTGELVARLRLGLRGAGSLVGTRRGARHRGRVSRSHAFASASSTSSRASSSTSTRRRRCRRTLRSSIDVCWQRVRCASCLNGSLARSAGSSRRIARVRSYRRADAGPWCWPDLCRESCRLSNFAWA